MEAKDVKEFFERVASDWDAMRLAYYDERVIEKMAEVSGVGEASEVADVGTGTGFVAAGIAPRVERVVGIDNAPAMLEVARENLRALGASNVDLVVGEASLLPLAQGAVDAAFANMVLHHAEDPEAMLREMARVVRPGGTVAITDEVAHPTPGCARNTPTSGSGSSEDRWSVTSARPGSKATATSCWGCSDVSAPRPRVRSPTSVSSPRGAESLASERARDHGKGPLR